MTRRRRAVWTLAILALLSGPAAMGAEITVQNTVTGGTRTLSLLAASGDSLSTIELGTTGMAPFLTNVTDVQYTPNDFQVTASMSGLYAWDGASFDCSTSIDSSNLSLGFLIESTSVADVEALAEATWDLTGNLPDPLATLLGVPVGTALSAADVAGEEIDRSLSGVFDGVEDTLPIKIAAGAGGAFTDPGPHSTCAPAPGSTTTHSLMDGQTNSLADLFTWVQNEIEAAADVDSGGTITADELVAAAEVTDAVMAAAVRQALADAGVDLGLVDTLIASGTLDLNDVYAILTAVVDPLSALVGQTGTYVSVPQLVASVPDQTPGGQYRGTMTVTLVDL